MLLASLSGRFGRIEKSNAEIMVLQAQDGDEQALHDLLFSYSPFMKKTASQVCKRFIDDHDDEYSVALSAFNEAIEKFDETNNASFLTFAHMVIRRRVIDFIRKENRREEFSHDFMPSAEPEVHNGIADHAATHAYTLKEQDQKRREEISLYETMLQEFGLSFHVLAKVSPAHEDARITSIQIAQLVAETDEYKHYLMDKKKLPIKEIEKLVKVSRKTIERNRKYIIAMALLQMSDLHFLKDYLKGRLN
ncbi:RNA polymerase sigma factor [Planomicrobium stackebrandtii]|uniref:RNA polymerase sigma factor SigI n=1 Tax=Planomicrobium stackebrandtii TaxID=253160 RepID=A0ABU0GUT0_9BACL|nr:RNA polymerase sigma-I factor [Planomicrobium stackebrandtii]MDQ0429106.1 RNA polymerase sigma factor [Planomicrobium stackebrandtii]